MDWKNKNNNNSNKENNFEKEIDELKEKIGSLEQLAANFTGVFKKEISKLKSSVKETLGFQELIEFNADVIYKLCQDEFDINEKLNEWIKKTEIAFNALFKKIEGIEKFLSETRNYQSKENRGMPLEKNSFNLTNSSNDNEKENLNNKIKDLISHEKQSYKSITEINKRILKLSENENKLAETLFVMSQKLNTITKKVDDIETDINSPPEMGLSIEQFMRIRSFINERRNSLIVDIKKSLKSDDYELIVDYINFSVESKNIYFYFNLSDEAESKKECSKFFETYLNEIKEDKSIELMYK
ncbi:hypothetical protein D8X55_03160 [Malacoplasma penetrans]|uniref:hypothetical protein n=1 Tax=Malacoplasma penetrans TaxID=28227 RepID=UPI00101035CA|nr:hypothetical protein [Malacoplasma penetrans]RXY96621.1 hypothetical protein D8X55_03160 [Malacoplasma penetrans]